MAPWQALLAVGALVAAAGCMCYQHKRVDQWLSRHLTSDARSQGSLMARLSACRLTSGVHFARLGLGLVVIVPAALTPLTGVPASGLDGLMIATVRAHDALSSS